MKSSWNQMWPDTHRQIQPEPELELDSVVAIPLLCMLMMYMKLCNLCINCSVLMSVIWFVLLLLHITIHNICLFECQLVPTSNMELTRLHDILLYWEAYCGFMSSKQVIHPAVTFGAIQHFGQIGNQTVKNSWISSTPEPDIWYIPMTPATRHYDLMVG